MIAALMSMYSPKPLLVGSFQNETADLLYEALDQFDCLREIILRVYSHKVAQAKKKANEPCMRNSLHIIQAERERPHREALEAAWLRRRVKKLKTLSLNEILALSVMPVIELRELAAPLFKAANKP